MATPVDTAVKPSSVEKDFWVYASIPGNETRSTSREEDLGHGKWLVFRNLHEIDETWAQICAAIGTGELKASAARSSTMRYNPTSTGPGPRTSGVICVYTTKEMVEEVGLQLIQLVKHDISYKTVEATRSRKYTHRGDKKVTEMTIFWDEGSLVVNPDSDTDVKKLPWRAISKASEDDVWHLNIATPKIYGHWTVFCKEDDDLTELWHTLKQKVESGELAGVVKLECPKKPKGMKDKSSVIFVHTVAYQEIRDVIGKQLTRIVRSDVPYTGTSKDRQNDYKMMFNAGKPYSSYDKQKYKHAADRPYKKQHGRGSDSSDWRRQGSAEETRAQDQAHSHSTDGAADAAVVDLQKDLKTLDVFDN